MNLCHILAAHASAGANRTVVTNGAIVANRLQIPTSSQTGVALFTCQRQHTNTSQGTSTNLVFTDIHWYMNTASWVIATLATTYTFKKWIEYPQGTFTPVLYSGSATAQLDGTTRTITSDPLGVSIPPGATYWEHTMNLTGVAAAHIELPASASVIGALDAKYTAANNTTPAHQSAGQASTFFFGSVLITGKVTGNAAAKSVVLFGDSILWGAGDITSVGSLQSSGPWARALDLAGLGHFKFGVASMKASDMASIISAASATYAPLQTLLNACATHAVIEFGANDLSLGSRTQAQLLADYQTIKGSLASPKWGLGTITCRSTSTDSYASVSGQTAKTDGTWSLLTSVNTAIRALPSGFNWVIDYADVVMTSRDSGVWKASPVVAFVPTTDGTHPSSLMASYSASNMTLALP